METENDLLQWCIEYLEQHTTNVYPKQNNEIQCSCPFPGHKDFSPSFFLNWKSGKWCCHGCGKAGRDLPILIALLDNISLEKATDILKREIIATPGYVLSLIKEFKSKKQDIENRQSRKLSKKALPPKSSDDKKAIEYLKSRGYSNFNKLKKAFDLYYCSSGRYRSRIICPIYDAKKRLVYFTNRATDGHPKKTLFPTKQECQIDRHYLGEHFDTSNNCIIVEGLLDCFRVYTFGYIPLSTLNCNITEEQFINIVNKHDDLTICFDADEAGIIGMKKLALQLYGLVNFAIMLLPDNYDPDKCTYQQFKKAYRQRFTLNLKDIKQIAWELKT